MSIRVMVAAVMAAVAAVGVAEGALPSVTNDPSTQNTPSVDPQNQNRYGQSNLDRFRPDGASGNNPVDDNYRRGVFGRRRRRVPYGESDPQLQSTNPFHQFNNARNLPMDVFKPRGGEVNDLAHRSSLADFAKGSKAFSLPYGGYSSFRNHVFRRATADPLFRMKLHRSVNGGDDPHNPMGVGWNPAAAGVSGTPGMSANLAHAMAAGPARGVLAAPFVAPPHPNFLSDGTPYPAGANPFVYPHDAALGAYPYAAYGYGYHPGAGTAAAGFTTAVNPYEASMAGVSPYALPTATAHPYGWHPAAGAAANPYWWHPAAGTAALAPNAELRFLHLAAQRGGGLSPHAFAYDPLHWHSSPPLPFNGRLGNQNARAHGGGAAGDAAAAADPGAAKGGGGGETTAEAAAVAEDMAKNDAQEGK